MKSEAHVWVVEYRSIGSETGADAEWNITGDCFITEKAAALCIKFESGAEKRLNFRIRKYVRPPPCGSEGK